MRAVAPGFAGGGRARLPAGSGEGDAGRLLWVLLGAARRL